MRSGVGQVIAFNWPKLVGGGAAVAAGLRAWRRLPVPLRVVTAGAGVWTPLSLLASWWVYDRSPLRRWRFFRSGLPDPDPARVVVAVAGFDDVSARLRQVFTAAGVEVVDVIARPGPSVRRARSRFGRPGPVVSADQLAGLEPADQVLFAQAVHELRDPVERASMLRAAARIAPTVVVVDHLRDAANLLAFGPGAWHFSTARTYDESFAAAGLEPVAAGKVGGLVRWWVLERAAG